MTIDVTKLTMEERRDFLLALLPGWTGALTLPGVGDAKRGLAVLPLCSERPVPPCAAGESVNVGLCVNTLFKPHRLIVLEVPYVVTQCTPQCVPRPRRWWQRRRPDVVMHGEMRVLMLQPRSAWVVDCFFIGDRPAWLGSGALGGEAFGPERPLDLDWPTAQLGHKIQLRVSNRGVAPVPFMALLLGAIVRHEEDWAPSPRRESIR